MMNNWLMRLKGFFCPIKQKIPSDVEEMVWLDSENGNDLTGRRGRRDKPFKTLYAAIKAAKRGDVVSSVKEYFHT